MGKKEQMKFSKELEKEIKDMSKELQGEKDKFRIGATVCFARLLIS